MKPALFADLKASGALLLLLLLPLSPIPPLFHTNTLYLLLTLFDCERKQTELNSNSKQPYNCDVCTCAHVCLMQPRTNTDLENDDEDGGDDDDAAMAKYTDRTSRPGLFAAIGTTRASVLALCQ